MVEDTPEDDKVEKSTDLIELRGDQIISNPNSPIENEKILNEIEERENKDRIELDIKEPIKSKAAKVSNDIVGMGLNL
jgi:hypothetical protein